MHDTRGMRDLNLLRKRERPDGSRYSAMRIPVRGGMVTYMLLYGQPRESKVNPASFTRHLHLLRFPLTLALSPMAGGEGSLICYGC